MAANQNSGFSKWAEEQRKKYGNLKNLSIPQTLNDLWEKAGSYSLAGKDSSSFQCRLTLERHPTIKSEHLWERVITQSLQQERFYNQFSLIGTNNIDLLQKNAQGEIFRLFELKTGSNELSHAAYEIVFYYFLLRRASNLGLLKDSLAPTIDLIVLAPNDYYKTEPHHNFLTQLQKALLTVKDYGNCHIKFMPLLDLKDRAECRSFTKILRKSTTNDRIDPKVEKQIRDYFLSYE